MFLVEILVLKYTFEIHYNLTLVLHWFKQAFETIFSMNHVCTKNLVRFAISRVINVIFSEIYKEFNAE